MHSAVPAVKIPDRADAHRIRRPDGKINALRTVNFHRMRSQLLINRIMNAGVKLFRVLFCNLRFKIIGVFHLFQRAVFIFHDIFIGKKHFSRNHRRKIARFINAFHLIALIPCFRLDTHLFRLREKSLNHNIAA